MCLQLIGFNHEKLVHRIKAAALPETPNIEKKVKNTKPIGTDTNAEIPESQYQDLFCIKANESLVQVKIVYNLDDIGKNSSSNRILDCKSELDAPNPVGRQCDNTEINVASNDGLIKGQTLLTSYFRPIQRKRVEQIDDSVELTIEINEPDSIEISDHQEPLCDRSNLLLHRKQIRRKYNRLTVCKYLLRKRLQQFLVRLAAKLRRQYSAHWRHRFQRNKIVQFVYRCLISYHEFTRTFLTQDNRGIVEKNRPNMTTEALVINRRIQKLLNDNNANMRDTNDEHPAPAHNPSDAAAKRAPKNQRTSDNARQLLLTENAQESNEKDFCE